MNTLVANRYAQAFFEYAVQCDASKNIEKEMSWLNELIESSKELQSFLRNPIISSEKRIEILTDIFKKHLSKLMFTYLLFLENKNRLDQLMDICCEFKNIYLKSINTICPKISSPVSLSTKQLDEICHQLKNKFKKNIIPDTEVNPELLGGIRIQINDKVIDHSLRCQLNNFEHAVMHA